MPSNRQVTSRRKDRVRIELAPDREAWEQQPGEPDRAYQAMTAFRLHALPRPQLPSMAEGLGLKINSLQHWSAKWDWTRRVAAWDEHVAQAVNQAALATHTADAVTIAKRQLEHSEKLHALGTQELNKLLHLSATSAEPIMGAKTLLQILTMAMALDRSLTADAKPDEGTRAALDLTELDDMDLRRLREMALKIQKGGTA